MKGSKVRFYVGFDVPSVAEAWRTRLLRFCEELPREVQLAFDAIPSDQELSSKYRQAFLWEEGYRFDDEEIHTVFGHTERASITAKDFHSQMELDSVAVWSAGTDNEQGVFDFTIGRELNDQWMTVFMNLDSKAIIGTSWEN
ncbi:MAG: hypothetical protein ACI8T1_004964 [Verrucomicrobiales bacterium]